METKLFIWRAIVPNRFGHVVVLAGCTEQAIDMACIEYEDRTGRDSRDLRIELICRDPMVVDTTHAQAMLF